MLIPDVTVVVHPIDTTAHPTQPAGFRWAVMVGGAPPADLDLCAHAGWAPDQAEAWFDGESHGAACCRALRLLGVPAGYHLLALDHDPIPVNVEPVHLLNVTE